MITLNGIRNVLWCFAAFGIVACASTPMPTDKLALAKSSIDRAEEAQATQFALEELNTARSKLAVAQTAAEKHDADTAARLADEAEIDGKLAEYTARAKQQEQLASEMDASLRDLRNEASRNTGDASSPPVQPQQ